MRKYCFVALIALIMSAVSCNKNEIFDIREITDSIEYETSESIGRKMCYLGALGATTIGQAIQARTISTVSSVDQADVLVVNSSELDANKDVLKKAWQDGKIIMELHPDAMMHEAFWNYAGGPAYLRSGDANDLVLIAVKQYSCYQLQNPLVKGVFDVSQEEHKEDVSPESSKEDRQDLTNYNAVPVAISDTKEFWNTKISSLVSWVNQNGGQKLTSAEVPTFDGDISKRITDANFCQCITKTFNVGADNYKICQVKLSDPDLVSRHSTIDVTIYIAPLYSYELNNNTKGDYYFVTTEVVSHNKPLYGLYKEWHGWVRTWAHVFYGKHLKFGYRLLTADRKALSGDVISFFQTPTPETTTDGRTYNKGFTRTYSGNGQLGISAGKPTAVITVGASFTWSNSQSRTVADQSIEMSTGPSDRKVSYTFHCNNDREEDSTEDAIPALARSDQKCEASWIWHVNNTHDDDTNTSFVLEFTLNPEYGCRWRHATWTCEGDFKTANLLAESQRTNYFNVVMPDRIRTGVLEIKATSSQYMQGLTITDAGGNVVAKDDGAYEKNQIQRYQIPVGVYTVEYSIRDGDTGELLSKRRIKDVKIETSETTKKSSMDGEIIG